MATAHLICGFLGAGKTTFSKTLTEQKSAVRFSVDELYLQLFADEPTHHMDAKAVERLLVALNDIWSQVVKAGVDVVLDFGFWHQALRDDVRERAHSVGAATQLYWLRVPDEVALARCLQRNGTPGSFLISAQQFQELKAKFEPPGSDELSEMVKG